MNNSNITYLEKLIHEMSSPIQNLSLIPDLMLDKNIRMSKVDRRENLQYIQSSAIKLVQIVRMISAITNLKSEKITLDFVETNLIDLINKEISYHTLRLKQDKNKQLEISFNIKVENCKAKVYSFWYGQLLANLIINAINHTEKGTIEVILDTFGKDNTDFIRLTVIDSGCGIPENELEEIFQPLKRGSHSIGRLKGSGIGLAVTKEIAEAHGGSIEATNNENGGAIFEVVIPVERKLSLFKK